MSFGKVYSAQITYFKPHIIDIEVDLSNGMHAFSIVGLADKATDESRDRIAAAIKNSGFKSPKAKNQKVIISLAPADVKKEGPLFDVGMAVAYLQAAGEIKFNAEKKIFLGELSLNGELRKVTGILPLVQYAKEKGFEEIFLPHENAREAALIAGIKIYSAHHLKDILYHITEKRIEVGEGLYAPKILLKPEPPTPIKYNDRHYEIDFRDIKGQGNAKRALEIAAAGGHNIAMYGPPGTGKTMLAKAFTHLLPELSFKEILEVTSIYSISGALSDDLIIHPPLRAPHHTSSYASLLGGGAQLKPGEITLAHKGVLFLDEFPEFDRRVIDSLRLPLEEKIISITRTKGSVHFPADFILIAAMNPCPCGNHGISDKICTCTSATLERYKHKISGPIIDRIDIWIEVSRIDYDTLLSSSQPPESTQDIKKRVLAAREIQKERFKDLPATKTNSALTVNTLPRFIELATEVSELLSSAAFKMGLSVRSYHRLIKLARTIADLAGSKNVKPQHMLEALQYRPKKLDTT